MITELNNLLKELDNKYNINSGGCCLIAYYIAKNLEKLNISYKFIIGSDSCFTDRKAIKKELITKKRNNNGCTGEDTCSHYYLKIKNKAINYMKCRYNYCFTADSKIIFWVYENGNWNDTFNIKCILTIRSKINKFFKNYEENDFCGNCR